MFDCERSKGEAMQKFVRLLSVALVLSGVALAQETGIPKTPTPDRENMERGIMKKKMMMDDRGRVELRTGGPGGERAPFPQGKFWKNTEVVQRLGLNDSQVASMEKIFQD